MSRINLSLRLGVLAIGLVRPVGAQLQNVLIPLNSEQAAMDVVSENTKLLKVEMQLDRREYLAGEMAELTVTITNPTQRPLLVFRPFWVETGDIRLLTERSDRFEVLKEKEGTDLPGPSSRTTILLQPAEQRVRRIRTDESEFEDWLEPLTKDQSVPLKAGHYRFEYDYGPNATVDFDVVEATIHEVQRHEMPLPQSWPAGAHGRSTRFAVSVAHVEARGEHTQVLARRGHQDLPPNETAELTHLAPFVRLGIWARHMPEVQVSMAEDGTLVATWLDEDGTSKRLELRPPKEPELFHVIDK